MGIVKFRTDYSADRIKQIEVLRETEACVYLSTNTVRNGSNGERREAKHSTDYHYHDSWAEAHAYLLKKAERNVEGAQFQIEHAKSQLDAIKGMKPPKESA